MQKNKVAVVILNWNGKSFLEKFLPSVTNYNSSFSQIIVADNNSTDDSISFLKKHYPQISIIQNKQNGGYAKGYNDALQHVNADYFVLLNSDVEVTPNWLQPVIELMESDKSIAACQPKIKNYNNKNVFEYAGAAGGFIDKFAYPFCAGRILDNIEEDHQQYNQTREIFWATGACLFVRADCFRLVEGFDEDFFAHMEEIDLCWRLKNRGFKIMYQPDSTVYHVGGGTLNKVNPHKTYLNFRNNLLLICKNHPPQFFAYKIFVRLILDGIAGAKFLFGFQPAHCWAVLKAHFSFYKLLPATLSKRKKLKLHIKNYTTTAVYLHSIIVDFYLRGKRNFSDIDKKERFL
jgi:GT2 family glycosyltransferase